MTKRKHRKGKEQRNDDTRLEDIVAKIEGKPRPPGQRETPNYLGIFLLIEGKSVDASLYRCAFYSPVHRPADVLSSSSPVALLACVFEAVRAARCDSHAARVNR